MILYHRLMILYHRLMILYHRLMIRWHGWRMHRVIARMKAVGRRHGLTGLDGYSDEAIAEGFRRLHDRKEGSP